MRLDYLSLGYKGNSAIETAVYSEWDTLETQGFGASLGVNLPNQFLRTHDHIS